MSKKHSPPELTDEMIQDFLENLDEGIHIVNADGMTIFYNRMASLLDGLTVEEVMGNHVLEAFPSLTHKTSTLMKVIKTGVPIAEQQQTYMNRNGKQIITVNKTVPLRRNGKVVGAVEIAKDITRIKELSEQIIQLQERMQVPKANKGSLQTLFYHFHDIITQNPVMLKEIERAKRASLTQSPVLVVGETGTGKELIVQSIHSHSPRKNQSFIAQNCAAIPSSLLEGILFGTAKGAFTGAEDRPGLFELADGGTLFLDEIHAMPIDLQAKLLRVLEERAVRRVGATQLRPVDVRIIVATNEDPFVSIQEGRLRRDLYYRIHVVGIHLPPLVERREDIELLTRHFLQKMKTRLPSPVEEISQEVLDLFHGYHWPGNVRELEHTVEGALNLATGNELKVEHLPPHFRSHEQTIQLHSLPEDQTLRDVLASVEEQMVKKALKQSGGNVLKAAQKLGIPRQTLQYKLKKLGLEAHK